MKMTFRWYGNDDPVTLDKIKQIPNVTGLSVPSMIYQLVKSGQWKESSSLLVQFIKKD